MDPIKNVDIPASYVSETQRVDLVGEFAKPSMPDVKQRSNPACCSGGKGAVSLTIFLVKL